MVYGSFRAFRPRHPLARFAASVIGVGIVVLLVAIGMFAFAALLIGGLVLLVINALRGAPANAAPAAAAATPPRPGVIEGEFTVVPGAQEPAPRPRAH